VNGKAALSIAVGSLFLYSGLKRYSVLQAIQNIIRGQSPGSGQASSSLGSSGNTATTSSGGPVRGLYDHSSLMQLWESNGGSAGSANNAACHAMQESSGNPKITSANPDGGTNVGLWQLDTKGVGAGKSIAWLSDPNNNARLTVETTHDGQDWSLWSSQGC
jgi:hypothetical protein